MREREEEWTFPYRRVLLEKRKEQDLYACCVTFGPTRRTVVLSREAVEVERERGSYTPPSSILLREEGIKHKGVVCSFSSPGQAQSCVAYVGVLSISELCVENASTFHSLCSRFLEVLK
jgi:hypothetical protein